MGKAGRIEMALGVCVFRFSGVCGGGNGSCGTYGPDGAYGTYGTDGADQANTGGGGK